MAQCGGRDFLFCTMCGTMLSLKSSKRVKCRLCGHKLDAQEIVGREIRYTITAEDMRRELGMTPFIKLDGPLAGDDKDIERARVSLIYCQRLLAMLINHVQNAITLGLNIHQDRCDRLMKARQSSIPAPAVDTSFSTTLESWHIGLNIYRSMGHHLFTVLSDPIV
ncbi:hypothetical protein Sjap_009931 [Stephania japonica]|uniref:Uncharacterized protein n=1 Tax=Stephania japonica TaxID=461633 RepID=A0AAP0P457_9MAGN